MLQFYSTAETTLNKVKGNFWVVLCKKKNPIWGSVVDGRFHPEGWPCWAEPRLCRNAHLQQDPILDSYIMQCWIGLGYTYSSSYKALSFIPYWFLCYQTKESRGHFDMTQMSLIFKSVTDWTSRACGYSSKLGICLFIHWYIIVCFITSILLKLSVDVGQVNMFCSKVLKLFPWPAWHETCPACKC